MADGPLEGLPRAHRPAEHERQPFDAELLGDEPVLDGHVVPHRDVGEPRPVERLGVLLGEDDSPLPSMLGTMMKYRLGSRPRPSPISHSFSQCRPEYQVG